jgi:hypothetical protein
VTHQTLADDACSRPDRARGIEDAMQAYLRSEANLPDPIACAGEARVQSPAVMASVA